MNREDILKIAEENGVELPKGMVTQMLSAFNADKKNAVVEAANKALEDFKDYKSPEEYALLQEELEGVKNESAKAGRKSKLKEAKIADKWADYVDDKLKDSKDYDKALAEFIKENPELLVKETTPTPTPTKTPEPQKFNFGGTGSSQVKPDAPKSMADAVKEYYSQKQ